MIKLLLSLTPAVTGLPAQAPHRDVLNRPMHNVIIIVMNSCNSRQEQAFRSHTVNLLALLSAGLDLWRRLEICVRTLVRAVNSLQLPPRLRYGG